MKSIVCLDIWYTGISRTFSGFYWFSWYRALIYCLFFWVYCVCCIWVKTKCFVCLTASSLFLILLFIFLFGVSDFLLQSFYKITTFWWNKIFQLQKILKLLVPFLYWKFAHGENSLHIHGFGMEYLDDQ